MLFFLMCELLKFENIFLRDMVENKCANIFSTHVVDLSFQNTLTHENIVHASVYESHSVKFACIERENICIYMYPQLIF